MPGDDHFLSRWSRRKHRSREGVVDEAPPAQPAGAAPVAPTPSGPGVAAPTSGVPVVPGRAPASTGDPPDAVPSADPRSPASRAGPARGNESLALPPLESLTPASDFRPFMQAGVDAGTRNAALAQLFRDPHFNVMDGLDVYIDDYNKTEPIPPTMLARLKQLHGIGLSDDEIEQQAHDLADEERVAQIGASGSARTLPASAPGAAPDEATPGAPVSAQSADAEGGGADESDRGLAIGPLAQAIDTERTASAASTGPNAGSEVKPEGPAE